MTAQAIALLLLRVGIEIAKLFSVEFDDIMAELNKRHEIEGKPSDNAAAEMDSHMSDR